MSFSKFDSRSAADSGAWLHVRDPATGEPIYDDGKPCRVKVRGLESKKGVAAMSKMLKAGRANDGIDLEESHARNIASAAGLIMDFENISDDAGPLKAPEGVEWFLGLGFPLAGAGSTQKTFAQQVNEFALDRANYLGNGLKP